MRVESFKRFSAPTLRAIGSGEGVYEEWGKPGNNGQKTDAVCSAERQWSGL